MAVDYTNYEGVTHEFFGMGAVVSQSREATKLAAANLKKAFTRDADPGKAASTTTAPSKPV